MFTGLVKAIGEVRSVDRSGGDVRFVIATDMDLSGAEIGASIACAGCCLTVVEKGDDWFAVDVSAETLSKTCLGEWVERTRVNLEPSLKMGDELGGHIVSGHVDGLAVLTQVKQDGGSHRLVFEVPDDLAKFIAPKGSVALDGVSLTVNEVSDASFGVNIIPHTWSHTTFHQLKEGGKVHLEIDVLARYAARILDFQR